MDPIPIKSLPEGTKVLYSLIDTGTKEDNCSDACKLVAQKCINGSFQIQGIEFDEFYSPLAHSDSFRINISISDNHRLTASILYISNDLHNLKVPINERVCVIPTPYYLDWFEKSYPNFHLN